MKGIGEERHRQRRGVITRNTEEDGRLLARAILRKIITVKSLFARIITTLVPF